MFDIIKIIKTFEDSDILLKGVHLLLVAFNWDQIY